jgi:hypothetical protein
MPDIRLVMSRRKFMLSAKDPNFRAIAMQTLNQFYRGTITLEELKRFLSLYPVDHIVIDYGSGRGEGPARVMRQAGWQKVGRAGRYEVWRSLPRIERRKDDN